MLIKKICMVCGKEFETDNKNTKICSSSCRLKRELQYRAIHQPVKQRFCLVCGKEIPRNKYFCDDCREKRKNDRLNKIKHNKEERICPVCGKTFIPRIFNQINCSTACSYIYHNKTHVKQRLKDDCIIPYGTTERRINKFGSFENFQNYASAMLKDINLKKYFNKGE